MSRATAQVKPSASDIGSDLYTRLRDAITSERFQPNERLVELDLVHEFHTSRTAVRSALIRLEQEGLVIHEPNRGARVRLVTESEAVQISEARAALEAIVAYHAAINATDSDVAKLRLVLRQMRERLRAGDPMGYSNLNAELHECIRTISKHEIAIRLLSTLNSQTIRFQFRTILHPGRPEQSIREHTAIVDAIAAHDPSAAEAKMREHLRQVVKTLKATIQSRQFPR